MLLKTYILQAGISKKEAKEHAAKIRLNTICHNNFLDEITPSGEVETS